MNEIFVNACLWYLSPMYNVPKKPGDSDCFLGEVWYNPIFDSFLRKKVSQPALTADCGTFSFFMNIRYAIYFFVCEQIFLILDIGMISFDVQNPNALCKASVSSVLV